MQPRRLDFIDITKAYLIILVIVGHILIIINPAYDNLYLSLIQECINAFHMAAFFLIHGMLFNIEKYKKTALGEFIHKQIYTLMIPYLFFEIFGIIVRFFTQKQSVLVGIKNVFTIRCNVGADWFLPAMFIGNFLVFVIAKYLNKSTCIVITIAFFAFAKIMSGNQLLTVITRGLLAYGFIMIGYFGKELFIKIKNHNYVYIIFSLMLLGICSICNLKFGGNDFYTGVINNPVTLIIGGIAGTILMMEIAKLFSNKYIALVGRHTLTIMGTHQLIIYTISALIPGLKGNILLCLGLLAVIIIVEIPVVYIIDSYLPFLVGRKWSSIKK